MLALLLAFAAVPAVAAPAVPAPKLDLVQIKADTKALSDDAMEGRRPGTPGGDKAVAYIIQRMQAIGLQPGNKGSWTQDVPLVTITADPKVTVDFASGDKRLSLVQGRDVVVGTKRQVPEVSVKASDVVFVGFGINAPERGWNDYKGLDVHGKTVVILVNDPDWETAAAGPDAGLFEGRAMTYYGRYTYKYEEAARQGAAMALVVHSETPAAYPWGVVQSSWSGPQIDLDRPDKGEGRVAVEGWITEEAAAKLVALGGKDLAQLTAKAKTKGFVAAPLPVTASTRITNTIVPSVSKNVIGVLPGAKTLGEVVLLTAHWDHLGRCTPDASGDDICNGALDNATGTAGLLGLAAAFKAAPPTARSLVFLAVTAEESGLLGSKWYAEHPVFPLKDTVGGVNMDGLAILGATRDVVVTGAGKSELEPLYASLAAAQGRTVQPEPTPEKGFYYRSDHFSFAKLGVPMLDAGSGNQVVGKPEGWGQAQADAYTAKNYHKPSDEYSEDWDWGGAVQDLTLYYQFARTLADTGIWPNWYKNAEFRAVRDASRAGASR